MNCSRSRVLDLRRSHETAAVRRRWCIGARHGRVRRNERECNGCVTARPVSLFDEAQLRGVKVGELADIASGASQHKILDLAPGSYVAFCNIVSGTGMGGGMMGGMNHVHFVDGRHTTFTVTA